MSICPIGFIEFQFPPGKGGESYGDWYGIFNAGAITPGDRFLISAVFEFGGLADPVIKWYRGVPDGLSSEARAEWNDPDNPPENATWALWSEIKKFGGRSEIEWRFYPSVEAQEKCDRRHMRKETVVIHKEWQLVFEVMRRLAEIVGETNVRLTMWFS